MLENESRKIKTIEDRLREEAASILLGNDKPELIVDVNYYSVESYQENWKKITAITINRKIELRFESENAFTAFVDFLKPIAKIMKKK